MASYLDVAKWKWRGLLIAVKLRGKKEGDMWRLKRPTKFVKMAEEPCKLKTTLLLNNPDEFPNLQHPSGCSLQYIIMLNHLLGGEPWHLPYINKYVEFVPECNENEMANLLGKLAGKAKNVRR